MSPFYDDADDYSDIRFWQEPWDPEWDSIDEQERREESENGPAE